MCGDKGIAAFKRASRAGEEGVMAKLATSRYYSGERTRDWLKVKASLGQEVVIVGFTAPRRSREYFGSLLLAVRDGNAWRYVGRAGTGFDREMLKSLHALMVPLITTTKPVAEKVPDAANTTWIKPKLVGEVKFTEWTAKGEMRHPVFLGLRTDKKATDVIRENPKPGARPAPLTPARSYFQKDFTAGEVRMRFLGAVEQLIHVGLFRRHSPCAWSAKSWPFATRASRWARSFSAPSWSWSSFKAVERRLAPLGVLLAGKDAGEELDRIAQILCPDAELVALLGAERAQVRAVFPDPLASTREELGGVVGDFFVAALAQVFVARPRPGLDPFGDVEQGGAEPVRAHRADRRPIGLGASFVEGAAGLGVSRIAAMGGAHRLQDVDLEHVEITGRPELVGDPFQLGLDPLLLGISDDLLEGNDGGTDASQADAHLM